MKIDQKLLILFTKVYARLFALMMIHGPYSFTILSYNFNMNPEVMPTFYDSPTYCMKRCRQSMSISHYYYLNFQAMVLQSASWRRPMMFWNNYKSLLMRSFCLEPIGLTLMNWPRAYTGFVAVIDFSFCSVLSSYSWAFSIILNI